MAPEDLAGACDALVAEAFERSSSDNMTVLAVLLASPPSAERRLTF